MQDTNNYQMFNLIGNEFTFDVDLSQLPCGLNGALYFVSMPQKGQGTPGAKYGTGMTQSHLMVLVLMEVFRLLRCSMRARFEVRQWQG
jgi:hypothetical protein